MNYLIKYFLILSFFVSLHKIEFAQSKNATSPCEKKLWEYSYLITGENSIPTGVMTETFCQSPKKRYFYKSLLKTKDDKSNLIEETTGAFANQDLHLSPIAFNYILKGLGLEITADGSTKDNKYFFIKTKRNDKKDEITRPLPKEAFLSSFFPLWLAHHLPKQKPKSILSFQAIREDDMASDQTEEWYKISKGSVEILGFDDFAKKTKSLKLKVIWENLEGTWYIEKSGAPLQIEYPTIPRFMTRMEPQEAERKFLSGLPLTNKKNSSSEE